MKRKIVRTLLLSGSVIMGLTACNGGTSNQDGVSENNSSSSRSSSKSAATASSRTVFFDAIVDSIPARKDAKGTVAVRLHNTGRSPVKVGSVSLTEDSQNLNNAILSNDCTSIASNGYCTVQIKPQQKSSNLLLSSTVVQDGKDTKVSQLIRFDAELRNAGISDLVQNVSTITANNNKYAVMNNIVLPSDYDSIKVDNGSVSCNGYTAGNICNVELTGSVYDDHFVEQNIFAYKNHKLITTFKKRYKVVANQQPVLSISNNNDPASANKLVIFNHGNAAAHNMSFKLGDKLVASDCNDLAPMSSCSLDGRQIKLAPTTANEILNLSYSGNLTQNPDQPEYLVSSVVSNNAMVIGLVQINTVFVPSVVNVENTVVGSTSVRKIQVLNNGSVELTNVILGTPTNLDMKLDGTMMKDGEKACPLSQDTGMKLKPGESCYSYLLYSPKQQDSIKQATLSFYSKFNDNGIITNNPALKLSIVYSAALTEFNIIGAPVDRMFSPQAVVYPYEFSIEKGNKFEIAGSAVLKAPEAAAYIDWIKKYYDKNYVALLLGATDYPSFDYNTYGAAIELQKIMADTASFPIGTNGSTIQDAKVVSYNDAWTKYQVTFYRLDDKTGEVAEEQKLWVNGWTMLESKAVPINYLSNPGFDPYNGYSEKYLTIADLNEAIKLTPGSWIAYVQYAPIETRSGELISEAGSVVNRSYVFDVISLYIEEGAAADIEYANAAKLTTFNKYGSLEKAQFADIGVQATEYFSIRNTGKKVAENLNFTFMNTEAVMGLGVSFLPASAEGSCTVGMSLAPNQECLIGISYVPVSADEYKKQLTVYISAMSGDSPIDTKYVTYYSSRAAVVFGMDTNLSGHFEDILPGEIVSHNVLVSNSGNKAYQVCFGQKCGKSGQFEVTRLDPNVFNGDKWFVEYISNSSTIPACDKELAPGKQCQFKLTVKPTTYGTKDDRTSQFILPITAKYTDVDGLNVFKVKNLTVDYTVLGTGSTEAEIAELVTVSPAYKLGMPGTSSYIFSPAHHSEIAKEITGLLSPQETKHTANTMDIKFSDQLYTVSCYLDPSAEVSGNIGSAFNNPAAAGKDRPTGPGFASYCNDYPAILDAFSGVKNYTTFDGWGQEVNFTLAERDDFKFVSYNLEVFDVDNGTNQSRWSTSCNLNSLSSCNSTGEASGIRVQGDRWGHIKWKFDRSSEGIRVSLATLGEAYFFTAWTSATERVVLTATYMRNGVKEVVSKSINITM